MDADLQDYPMASSKKGTPEGNAIFFAKPVESLSRKSSDRGSTPLGSTKWELCELLAPLVPFFIMIVSIIGKIQGERTPYLSFCKSLK